MEVASQAFQRGYWHLHKASLTSKAQQRTALIMTSAQTVTSGAKRSVAHRSAQMMWFVG